MTSYKYQKKHASNYNYKGKRSFGQKLKNFFTIPEEDLKEEPSKEFEKIKLFTLTRGILFLGILVFMILINILVAFNINFLYLRQILGFLFLILIPGLLIMLCFKIRTVKFWEYLVYTVGLSIAFIMFAGLAVNWTLPALNITDKPLSLWPILICFDIFLIGLWLTAIYRNRDLKPFDITIPKLDAINRIFFIIPMIFPLLSILGAFLLNNHGPNILTMIMLGGIAVYVLLITIFRKRMNENVWPWALYWIGLALLLSGWMRSWFVSGVDINLEFSLFKSTYNNEIWKLYNLSNNYDSMLSLTILPTIISLFIKLNSSFLFKLAFPVLFSIFPIILYLISRIYFKSIICFMASFFFMAQYSFLTWMAIPVRQEIAFIFFGLMFLVLFTNSLSRYSKKVFFVFFGISMIVSHYSTSYIALAIFSLAYVFILVYKNQEKQKIKKGKIYELDKSNFYLTGALILLLLTFGFLWYSQLTPTANGLIDFVGKSVSNFNNMLDEEVHAEGKSPIDQLRVFKRVDYTGQLNDYQKDILIKYNNTQRYDENLYKDYKLKFAYSDNLPIKIDLNIFNILLYFEQYFKFFMGKLLIVLGALLMMFIFKEDKKYKEYQIILFITFLISVVIIVLPFITIRYDLMRIYQQILIILNVSAVISLVILFKNIKDRRYLLIFIFLIIYFLFTSNFVLQIIGGNNISLKLNSFGSEYDTSYSHVSEYLSSYWLIELNNVSNRIHVDNRALYKLYLSRFQLKVFKDVTPPSIGSNNYVYSSYTNTHNDLTFKSFNGNLLPLNFPEKFLVQNKNKIYCNGDSEIFK